MICRSLVDDQDLGPYDRAGLGIDRMAHQGAALEVIRVLFVGSDGRLAAG